MFCSSVAFLVTVVRRELVLIIWIAADAHVAERRFRLPVLPSTKLPAAPLMFQALLQKLEGIVHPLVEQHRQDFLAKAGWFW